MMRSTPGQPLVLGPSVTVQSYKDNFIGPQGSEGQQKVGSSSLNHRDGETDLFMALCRQPAGKGTAGRCPAFNAGT